jgi:hypothetical protein
LLRKQCVKHRVHSPREENTNGKRPLALADRNSYPNHPALTGAKHPLIVSRFLSQASLSAFPLRAEQLDSELRV